MTDLLTFVIRNSRGDASAKAIVFCLIVWPTFEALDFTLVVHDLKYLCGTCVLYFCNFSYDLLIV